MHYDQGSFRWLQSLPCRRLARLAHEWKEWSGAELDFQRRRRNATNLARTLGWGERWLYRLQNLNGVWFDSLATLLESFVPVSNGNIVDQNDELSSTMIKNSEAVNKQSASIQTRRAGKPKWRKTRMSRLRRHNSAHVRCNAPCTVLRCLLR
jgi:hypothetical protein